MTDEKVKLFGGDQVLRTSNLIQEYLERVGEREDFRGEKDGSPPSDPIPDDSEARNDIWSISEFTFTVIALNHESNSVCRKKNHSEFHYDTLT